jgi:hypothetical protein
MVRQIAMVTVISMLGGLATVAPGIKAQAKEKVAIVKGTVYRGDKEHRVAGATLVLLDEKAGGRGNSVEANADENGNYTFDRVVEGKYTISIRTWYDRAEDVPCQLLAAKTKDKDSTLIVIKDKAKYVEQVLIKGFAVKANKEISRDFDIACKTLFG